MASNGKRRPPRPRIEIAAAGAGEEEAAAIAAALQRFMADTAPAPARPAEPNPWQRAALHEGVTARTPPFRPTRVRDSRRPPLERAPANG